MELDGWTATTTLPGDHFTMTRRLRGWRRLWAILTRRPTEVTDLYVVTASSSAGPTHKRYD